MNPAFRASWSWTSWFRTRAKPRRLGGWIGNGERIVEAQRREVLQLGDQFRGARIEGPRRRQRFKPIEHFAPKASRFALPFRVQTIDLESRVEERRGSMLALDGERAGPQPLIAGHEPRLV